MPSNTEQTGFLKGQKLLTSLVNLTHHDKQIAGPALVLPLDTEEAREKAAWTMILGMSVSESSLHWASLEIKTEYWN